MRSEFGDVPFKATGGTQELSLADHIASARSLAIAMGA
jgi:hypothetical protein